jgi:predicted N-acetyltransferase YhbS
MENILIRQEKPEDYREVEGLVREAFWDVYKPGCNEHFILHQMRSIPAFVPELDLVAVEEPAQNASRNEAGRVVGQIAYTKAKVVNEKGEEFEVLCMGPLAVLPSCQGKGVGSLLMEESIKKATELGYKAIIIFGEPEYYHRFGFKNAKEYGIQTSDGQNFEAFMTLLLNQNSLLKFDYSKLQGKFYADPVFEPKPEEVDEFDKQFPPREKHITDTQLKM